MNFTSFLIILILSSVVLSKGTALAQDAPAPRKPNPVLAPIEDEPELPRVLIIGDSISMGYTLETRARLKAVANLHRPPTNCGPTTKGLDEIDNWLGEGKWDVIHFNFGLHDLKYMGENGQLVAPDKGRQQVPIDQYEKNLDALVKRMKQTGATLIWRNTTPVPEGSQGRIAGDEVKYNQAAARVMAKHGVATHDLYTFVKAHEDEKIQRPRNVHFTPEGSKLLATEVAKVIKAALDERKETAHADE